MGSRPSFDFGVFDLPAAGRSTSAIHPPYDLGSLPFFCARAGSPAVQASTMPAMVATIVRTANILASWNSMRYLSRRLFGCFDILHPLRSEFLVLLFGCGGRRSAGRLRARQNRVAHLGRAVTRSILPALHFAPKPKYRDTYPANHRGINQCAINSSDKRDYDRTLTQYQG